MAITASLNDCYVLEVEQSAGAIETITVSAADVTNSFDFFDSNAGFIVKAIQFYVITAAGGSNIDVYDTTVLAANRLCAQQATTSTGVFQAQMAPIGALAEANLTIDAGGSLKIDITGGAAQCKVLLYIGKPSEKTVSTT